MICVNSVTVSPSAVTIRKGEWYYGASATVCPENADCKDVEWISGNTSVASVNPTTGYIYGVNVGTTRVCACATDGSGESDYITVTVTNGSVYVTDITLNRTSLTLEKGNTYTLTETVCPTNATNKTINWSSGNGNVATVNDGVVTAICKGSTYIYACTNDGSGEYACCYVTVTENVLTTSVTASWNKNCIVSQKSLAVGLSAFAYATVCPTNATNRAVRWKSDNTSVATVNEDSGLVLAQGTGTTIIRAVACDGSGEYGECRITVTTPIPVESVTIHPTSLSMNVGETKSLCVEILPENASNKTVVWRCSDEDIAEIGMFSGEITAKKAGIVTIRAIEPNTGVKDDIELWVHGKTPVFLIHGRDSNAEATWGIITNIPKGKNNHYAPSIDATANNGNKYTDVCSQEISTVHKGNSDNEDKPCNLGDELEKAGYKKNVNLFAFTYPNQDAVIHSAKKFEKYIENLIADVRIYGTDEMKACFYASRSDYNAENHKINLVAHSMGGLVSRYYIENLDQDDHVDKLITICTPHWGSPLAELSNGTGILHNLCDHDLDVNSAMYGGENDAELKEGCTLWDITNLWHECTNDKYILTDELRYNKSRLTKYYAIAGINYDSDGMSDNNFDFELQNTSENLAELNAEIIQHSQNKLYVLTNMDGVEMKVQFNAANVRDDIVGFLSQIGWGSLNESGFPIKKLNIEKTLVNIDTDGGNSLTSHFHSKMPHRREVTNKVIKYLEE